MSVERRRGAVGARLLPALVLLARPADALRPLAGVVSPVRLRWASASTREVNSADELTQVIDASRDRLAVLRFGSSSCRACAASAPRYNRIASRRRGVDFYEVDTSLASHCGVESTPTAVLYADGKQVDQVGCSLSRWQDFETALAAAECELECLLSAADADAIAEFDV